MIDMAIKFPGLEKVSEGFLPQIVENATRNTVNKTTAKASTAVRRFIRSEYDIKNDQLIARGTHNRHGIQIKKARVGHQTALLYSVGASLPLSNFGFKAVKKRGTGAVVTSRRGLISSRSIKRLTKRNTVGVSVRVKKKGGFKYLPGVFMATVRAGGSGVHLGFFERKGKARLPIEQKYGPGVPAMLKNKMSMQTIYATINKNYERIFEHEMDYQIKRAALR